MILCAQNMESKGIFKNDFIKNDIEGAEYSIMPDIIKNKNEIK